jgi:hypothetical protein
MSEGSIHAGRAPSPMGPDDRTKILRFPLRIQDDIPFLMAI